MAKFANTSFFILEENIMIKINVPSFVYDEFGIEDADFYNLDLANDNPKFLNPYEIELIENPVAVKATKVAVDFFETVRQLLFAGKYEEAKRIFCNNMTVIDNIQGCSFAYITKQVSLMPITIIYNMIKQYYFFSFLICYC